MPRPKPFRTIRELWNFAFDGLAAGGDRDTMTKTIEEEGYALDGPLPKNAILSKGRNERIIGLCEQIVAVAKAHPRAGQYYATVVAAAEHTIKIDKMIEDA